MRRFIFSIFILFLSIFISSCFVTTAALNVVSSSLSGSDKKGVPKKQKTENTAMLALTGETDVTLVGDFFPTALKLYEIIQTQNPNHLGLMSMTGSLNIMYANAFVQSPASLLSLRDFEKQNKEYDRAKLHYLRGRDFCIDALDGRHKGFKDLIDSNEQEKIDKAISMLDKNDVATAYWAGAGYLGAFSLDPLNADLLMRLSIPVAILERAAFLDPDYSYGAIWEILAQFYKSAPGEFGGDEKRALDCYEEALRASEGKTPGPYIIYAQSFCIIDGDEEGFVDALNKALAINPDDNPSTRLMTTINQEKARYLLKNKGDYFLQW